MNASSHHMLSHKLTFGELIMLALLHRHAFTARSTGATCAALPKSVRRALP